METSPLICSANQWTGFYVKGNSGRVIELTMSRMMMNGLSFNLD